VKTMTIGIMSQGRIRARALAIARGKYKPKPGEPKIWFPSMRSVAEVLSDENRALLHVIRESQPDSLGKLAQLTGRQVSNLSRTLKTMSNYGLVELKRSPKGREVRPIAKAREFMILAPA
jgi:predicted transcriptional regulator